MGVRCNSLARTRFRPRDGDVIINWGCTQSHLPDGPAVWLNPPEEVREAADKLLTLQALTEAGVPTLEYTTHYDEMLHWLNNGERVIARTMLRASSGRGIEVIHQDDDFSLVAPLYTRYFKGYDEYRVHIVNGRVIDIQQKRRRSDYDGEVDNIVRSYERGWVFCREQLDVPAGVPAAASLAVDALGLDFGAVDVKYNRHYDRCAVLEVNTAPGLQGSTLRSYAAALSQLVEENQ
jgi:glutathione synthase/RimK-type ligase-like ATP-grasp enzyme